ncbi:hypothetical protein ACET3Z_013322 [Daucus carota]
MPFGSTLILQFVLHSDGSDIMVEHCELIDVTEDETSSKSVRSIYSDNQCAIVAEINWRNKNIEHSTLVSDVGSAFKKCPRVQSNFTWIPASNYRDWYQKKVPDISLLRHLQFLDLEDNLLRPQFVKIRSKNLVTPIPGKKKFDSGILERETSSLECFQKTCLAVNLNCPQLEMVDLTGNFLNGRLPSCLRYDPRVRVLSYAINCLVGEDKCQHPVSFCRNETLAVGIIPHHNKSKQASIHVLAISISAGIVELIVLVAIILLTNEKSTYIKDGKITSDKITTRECINRLPLKMLQDAKLLVSYRDITSKGKINVTCHFYKGHNSSNEARST